MRGRTSVQKTAMHWYTATFVKLWNSCGLSGPDHWDEMHLVAKKIHIKQSPINIVPSEAVFEEKLQRKPLEVVYDASQAQQLINNGHSIQVTYDCEGSGE